jgi:hypothetical protein
MNSETLRDLLQSVEPAVQLVEPRILRRVIRLDRRLPGFGLSVLRRKSYAIERDRLLAFVDRSELDLAPAVDLPRVVILLARPSDDELRDPALAESILHRYGRLLLHASAKVELEERLAEEGERDACVARRKAEIGETEFAEIRSVLIKDEFLFPAPTDLETYCEFAATFVELYHLAPQELAFYFPAVRDWDAIDRTISHDIEHGLLYERLRSGGLTAGAAPVVDEVTNFAEPAPRQGLIVTLAEFRRLQAKAEHIAAVGNSVKAAIEHSRAALVAPPGYAGEARMAALGEVLRLAKRLQHVLRLPEEEAEPWSETLQHLLAPAAEGFWSDEARLLYDLQKVCVEQERGVYRLDFVDWIRTRGKRPLRRPLPLLRDALMVRHLRTARRRIATARIPLADRERLKELLEEVVERIEHRSRDRFRPVIATVLQQVGLVPQNVPEEVARRKLVEELLDRIVEHSYLNMGTLRDALSKNDLKLPDVLSLVDLVQGDRLLRADKKLDRRLDGVYRRGAIYQRWPQTLSSLAFGTQFGRFLTRHLALPFGGAYLALEFMLHVAAEIKKFVPSAPDVVEQVPDEHTMHESFAWGFYGGVLLLGVWLWLLIHRAEFRAFTIALFQRVWRIGKRVFIDFPARIIRSEVVQRILNSHAYTAIHNYVIRPGIATALAYLGLYTLGERWSQRGIFELFLIVALVLNSSVGRYVTEMTGDLVVRAWHELRIRVLGAVLQSIIDLFHALAVTLERVIYTVDEWLRFRAGDSRAMQSLKLVGSIAWFFVAYVIVFVFTLLIEPQVNPIKHFPVVTVSHKFILPTSPAVVKLLTQYIGNWAVPVGTLIITLIPGVFGYLVWELKENWRLYAANRPKKLGPLAIGSHGETMLRLLRPGFHSGTLPKAFAALRRAARKREGQGDTNALTRRQTAIHHVEKDLRRFVERELLSLLEQAGFLEQVPLVIRSVHAATNRIDVELERADEPGAAARLSWEEDAGKLVGVISALGWIDNLTAAQRQVFASALAGLFQRSGVEVVGGAVKPSLAPIAWDEWVAWWAPATADDEAPQLSIAADLDAFSS